MTNITREVWRSIENDAALKKNLLQNLINVSALARKIAKEQQSTKNIEAVISAIRRYENSSETTNNFNKINSLLKEAKLSTVTKRSSLLLPKNKIVRKKLGDLYKQIDFEKGDTLRIFEVSSYIEVIIDDKNTKLFSKTFDNAEILNIKRNLGELSINYGMDVTQVPGLFSTISNELASQDVSIVSSIICHSEHIIIVEEKNLEKAFNVIFRLTHF